VLQSLRLEPGSEVLLTDHAYGAVSIAARRQCRRSGASVRSVPVPLAATEDEIIARIRSALRPGKTKLLVVEQIASATAQVFPVRSIAAVAREHDIPVLVDGAHAPGMLPVDVSALGADFWVGNLHKWAFAPRGTALLAVAPDWRRRIDPLVASWELDAGFPLSVEMMGTVDYTSWLAAPAGLFVLRTLGVETVRAHNAALAAYGQRVVGAALGVTPADCPEPGSPAASMRVVPLPAGLATTDAEAQALRQHIADKLAVETAVHAWNGRGWLRLAAQIYNRPDEFDRLADRLPALLNAIR
jgi:isopenicillin-N epimerase